MKDISYNKSVKILRSRTYDVYGNLEINHWGFIIAKHIEAKKNGKLHGFWSKLKKSDLLILDEWGYIPFERLGTQLLFETVSACYDKRSVILTTNLPFDEWNTIFYDEKLTTAILDRPVHHGRLILHEGQSYRVLHSMMQ